MKVHVNTLSFCSGRSGFVIGKKNCSLTAKHVKLIEPDTLREQALSVSGVKHKP